MATFTILQISSKRDTIFQINNTLNQMITWMQSYNQFLISGWSTMVQGTNINYTLTAKDQTDFEAHWDVLKTQLLSQINTL